MKIQAINSSISSVYQTNLRSNKNVSANEKMQSNGALQSVSGSVALAQMPNVNFMSNHFNYGKDNFDAYDNYEGPQPPQIEIEKYRKSIEVQKHIDEENYLAAISGKIDLARICRKQGNERDAYMLENSIRELYKDLPKYQRDQAKMIISDYNHDMAKYIDIDINR